MDRVIRWMASPAAPAQARLLIVGDGPVRAELEQLAAGLKLGERVRFTGVVHRDRVPGLVAAFDVALQPAVVAYASPLKLIEYLALGKAIVAPNQPNIAELLIDDGNALLFDADDAAGLESSLARLAHEPALRQRLGASARDTIARMQLTWMGNARKAVELAYKAGARP
jgi:glycosyltransferase involved in cell wall biosynthesis